MAATETLNALATRATRPAWLVRFDARADELGATTPQQKADLMGVDRSTYWRYERGVMPRLPKGQEIARRISLSFGDLFGSGAP